MNIRIATIQDAAAIQAIYAPYVERTAITFEVEPPSVEQMRDRMVTGMKKHPWIVAEEEGRVVAYAYAGPFKGRESYNRSVELSIYVEQGLGQRGIGRALYRELEVLLAKQNVTNLYACIAYVEKDDEYLTTGSVRFHEKLGFQMIGVFHTCAHKFGRWYDMCWMEKMIGEHGEEPAPFVPFSKLGLV